MLTKTYEILLQKGQGEESCLEILRSVMGKIGVFFLNISVAMEVAMLVLKRFE